MPEWPRRQEALLFKTKAFFHKRSQFSQSWDLSLYQLLAFRLVTQWGGAWTIHSVYCWHISQSAQCQCVRRAEVGYTDMSMCNSFFASSTLVQDVLVGQVSKQGGITELSLDILQFMLSLVKTPERAVELSAVIPTYVGLCALFLNLDPSTVDWTPGFENCSPSALQIKIYTMLLAPSVQPPCLICQYETRTALANWLGLF